MPRLKTSTIYKHLLANITANTGGGQANATLLTHTVNVVSTVATSGDSVKLILQPPVGHTVIVLNDSQNPLAVFPNDGASIDNHLANAAVVVAPAEQATFLAITPTRWSVVSKAAEPVRDEWVAGREIIDNSGLPVIVFYHLVTHRGMLYAGGRAPNGTGGPTARVFRSANGVTWEQLTLPFSTTDNEVRRMHSSSIDGYLYVVTQSGTPRIYRSQDGSTWTLVHTFSSAETYGRWFTEKDGRLILAVAAVSSNEAGIAYTDNGTDWTKVAHGLGSNVHRNAVVRNFNGRLYLATNRAGVGGEGGVLMSANGESWRKITSVQFNQDILGNTPIGSLLHSLVEFKGAMYIGILDTTNGAGVFRSTDEGFTWTLVQNFELPYEEPYVLHVVGDSLICGLHSNAGEDPGVIYRTFDGDNWDLIKTFPSHHAGIFSVEPFNGYLYTAPRPATDGPTNDSTTPTALYRIPLDAKAFTGTPSHSEQRIVLETVPHRMPVDQFIPVAATNGTDTTPANGTTFVGTIQVPGPVTVVGFRYLVGSVGGTDRVYAALWDANGSLLGTSTLADGGTVVGTAAGFQTLEFTVPIALHRPGTYFVGIAINGTTARLRTLNATNGNAPAVTVSQTHGSPENITPPTTFTANNAPIGYLYR